MPKPRKREYITEYTMRTEPETIFLDCSSSAPHTVTGGGGGGEGQKGSEGPNLVRGGFCKGEERKNYLQTI